MYVRADRLVLLKNALLLGVSFKYGYEVAALQPPPASSVPRDGERPSGERESSWTAWVHGAASTATHQTANDVLAFKPQKDGEYTKGVGQGKCNQLQASTLDATFARAVGAPPPEGASAHRFDALLLAEGEWSPTCKKLGITKSIDRFSPAIGLGARSRRVLAACARAPRRHRLSRRADSPVGDALCRSPQLDHRPVGARHSRAQHAQVRASAVRAHPPRPKSKPIRTTGSSAGCRLGGLGRPCRNSYTLVTPHCAILVRPDATPRARRSSFTISPMDAVGRRLVAAGLAFEFGEYLKGETHYIVLTVKKAALLSHGVLRADLSGGDLLTRQNVDEPRLMALARKCATLVGLPETTAFWSVRPHSPPRPPPQPPAARMRRLLHHPCRRSHASRACAASP